VADTVGAGDAFTAGLLDGLRRADLLGGHQRDRLGHLDRDALRDLLDAANLVAALTCARPGANPPTSAEVEAFVQASATA
jgi:fructokinase